MGKATFTPSLDYYQFGDGGDEDTHTLYGTVNNAYTQEFTATSNLFIYLRVIIQENAGAGGAATDDYQLQVDLNGSGSWENVNGTSNYIQGYDIGNITEGEATTNRIATGSGDFVAGKCSEDGLVDNLELTKSDYTELLYVLNIIHDDYSDGDYVQFRVLHNGSTFTHNVTPRLNIDLIPNLQYTRFRFYEDGTESGSSELAGFENQSILQTMGSNKNVLLRIQVEETAGHPGDSTDDYQLTYSLNGGAYNNVTTSSSYVKGYNSASLTDGGATTNRLTSEEGSFVAGEVCEDGLVADYQLTAGNYTELLFALTLIDADLSDLDILTFKLNYNGSALTRAGLYVTDPFIKVEDSFSTDVNVEIPIDLIDSGISSSGISSVAGPRVYLNTDLYNNATYYFEVTATNSNGSTDYPIRLRASATPGTVGSVLIPQSTFTYARLRAQFYPEPGSADYYIQTPVTASSNQERIYSARIIVQQTDAYRTETAIPLLNDNNDYFANSGDVDINTGTSYSQGNENKFSYWTKDTTNFADLAGTPWTLEVSMNQDGGGTCYASLYNVTGGSVVANTEVSTTSTSDTHLTVNFLNTETNFDEGDTFDLRSYVASPGTEANLRKTSLRCRLTNLSKCESYYRVNRFAAGGASDDDFDYFRALYDASKFTNPTTYHEATAYHVSGTYDEAHVRLSDTGTSGSDTSYTENTSSYLTHGATKEVVRGACNLTSGYNYIGGRYHDMLAWPDGDIQIYNQMFVVSMTPAPDVGDSAISSRTLLGVGT